MSSSWALPALAGFTWGESMLPAPPRWIGVLVFGYGDWGVMLGRTPAEYAPSPWSPTGPSRTISPSV